MKGREEGCQQKRWMVLTASFSIERGEVRCPWCNNKRPEKVAVMQVTDFYGINQGLTQELSPTLCSSWGALIHPEGGTLLMDFWDGPAGVANIFAEAKVELQNIEMRTLAGSIASLVSFPSYQNPVFSIVKWVASGNGVFSVVASQHCKMASQKHARMTSKLVCSSVVDLICCLHFIYCF